MVRETNVRNAFIESLAEMTQVAMQAFNQLACEVAFGTLPQNTEATHLALR